MSTRILHLSDLHLGDDIPLRAIKRRRLWWQEPNQQTKAGLISAIRKLQPKYLVVSGDIVNKPNVATFRVAREYLRDLCASSNFDMQQLLIVPGNHDTGFLPRKNPHDLQRLRPYREFLRELFGEEDVESRRSRFMRVDPEGKVLFICMDSTLKNHVPAAEGEIGDRQRKWVRLKVERLSRLLGKEYSQYVKVAIFHHHCVGIRGTSTSSERFMQLLDHGDVMEMLHELGFNLVLHGHKHYPHYKPIPRSDSTVLMIVGAGTSACPWPEEQCGSGNNFFLVDISPEENRLSLQMYRANMNGEFEPVKDPPDAFPIFKAEATGKGSNGADYRIQHIRKVVEVESDGTAKIAVAQEGITALAATIGRIPFRAMSLPPGSRILGFDYDRTFAAAALKSQSDSAISGDWQLKSELRVGDAPIRVSYWYSIKDGMAMNRTDLARLGVPGQDKERTAVVVSHSVDKLTIEVRFPKNFLPSVNARVEYLGMAVPLSEFKHTLSPDPLMNSYRLDVIDPPQKHMFMVEWTVPDTWPIP